MGGRATCNIVFQQFDRAAPTSRAASSRLPRFGRHASEHFLSQWAVVIDNVVSIGEAPDADQQFVWLSRQLARAPEMRERGMMPSNTPRRWGRYG